MLADITYRISKNECPVNSFNIVYVIPLYSIKNNTPCMIAAKAHTNGVYILILLPASLTTAKASGKISSNVL